VRTRLIFLAAAGFVAGSLLAGCGAHHAAVAKPNPAAVALHERSAAAAQGRFTAVYALDSTKDAELATVRVYVLPTAFRVDVVEKTATASLYGGTDRQTDACTVASGIPTICYDVAAAGAPIPPAFDAGVQRVFQRDLPTFARTTDGLLIRLAGADATLTGSPGAQCYTVERGTGAQPSLQTAIAQIDNGTYCLTPGGLLTGFVSSSGHLVLSSHGAAPTAAELKVPATPQKLPASLASATASS
jgi:hypothetical protein